jgi:selenocysteine lyase/cysteine desulfurase
MSNRRSFLRNATLGLLGVPTLGKALPGNIDFSAISDDPSLFKLVRRSLLVPQDLVYLNTGSLGPSPRQIVSVVTSAMQELESNPVINNWGELGQRMEAVREKVARFINSETEEIILTRNTTEGINLIGSCLDLKPGDEILTTDHEHGGGENGLFYLQETRGAVVKKITMPLPAQSPQQMIDLVREGLTDRTRVVMLSHLSTITGLRMPFAEIAEITRPRGILLIADGAQAPGQVRVDVEALGVDAYAASGHKWLLGPKETGFLYLRKEVQEMIKPAFMRGSKKAYSAASGTRNVATIIGLGEALDWHQTIGIDKIEARCLELADYCRTELAKLAGLNMISPSHPELRTGMVSVQLTQANNREVFTALREKNMIVKVLPKFNALRFSMHLFNSQSDIDTLVDYLSAILVD